MKKRWQWVKRWNWIAGIIAAAIAVAAFFWKSEKIIKQSNPKNTQQGTTNVSSFNQSGGITAGAVNIEPGKRVLDESGRQTLDAATEGKKKITVVALWGDAGAFQLATEIFDYLKAKGRPVADDGVDQTIFNRPVKGQTSSGGAVGCGQAL